MALEECARQLVKQAAISQAPYFSEFHLRLEKQTLGMIIGFGRAGVPDEPFHNLVPPSSATSKRPLWNNLPRGSVKGGQFTRAACEFQRIKMGIVSGGIMPQPLQTGAQLFDTGKDAGSTVGRMNRTKGTV